MSELKAAKKKDPTAWAICRGCGKPIVSGQLAGSFDERNWYHHWCMN